MKGLVLLTALLLLGPPSEASGQPSVQRWGTPRDVLRDGRTEARVSLSELAEPGTFALGALEGLEGELIVIDGTAWVMRPAGPDAEGVATRHAAASDRATFAVASRVETWTEHLLSRDLVGNELEREVLRLATEGGLDATGTFPFVVEGKFRHLEAHVLAGACPFASDTPLPPELAPRRVQRKRTRGLLVGFHTGEQPGVISHHGSRSHVHALLDESGRPGGHLDSATVRAGSILRLPAATSQAVGTGTEARP